MTIKQRHTAFERFSFQGLAELFDRQDLGLAHFGNQHAARDSLFGGSALGVHGHDEHTRGAIFIAQFPRHSGGHVLDLDADHLFHAARRWRAPRQASARAVICGQRGQFFENQRGRFRFAVAQQRDRDRGAHGDLLSGLLQFARRADRHLLKRRDDVPKLQTGLIRRRTGKHVLDNDSLPNLATKLFGEFRGQGAHTNAQIRARWTRPSRTNWPDTHLTRLAGMAKPTP